MKSNEFDDLVRQSFDNARLPYNQENWQKLSAALDEKKGGKKRYFLFPIAAIAASVTAMAIGVVTWVNKPDNNTPVAAKKTPVTEPVRRNTPVQKANTTTGINNVGEPIVAAPNKPALQQNNVVVPTPERIPTPLPPVVKESPVLVQATPEPPVTPKANTPVVASVVKEKNDMPSIAAINSSNYYYDHLTPVKKEKKQYISMGGGLNYGTLSGGYVMGVAAGTKISERFYIESDVAFVGNMAGEKTKQSFVSQSGSSYGKSSSYSAAAPTTTVQLQRYYNIYYAQFTPTLGYKLAPKVSVGLGADVQRLLVNEKLVTETARPEDSRQLPVYDMGLVGKTEYNLTKEIKASMYYRKAMNQSLSGSKYLDRDYLQVQLKFIIFNK